MIKPHLLATCVRRDTGLATFLHNENAAHGYVLGNVWVALIGRGSADSSNFLGVVFFKSEEKIETAELQTELLKLINKDPLFPPIPDSCIELNNLGDKTWQGIAEFEAIARKIIVAHSGGTFGHDITDAVPNCEQARPTI